MRQRLKRYSGETMHIFSGIMLIGLIGLLWTLMLSLTHANGSNHNGRPARKKQDQAVEQYFTRAA